MDYDGDGFVTRRELCPFIAEKLGLKPKEEHRHHGEMQPESYRYGQAAALHVHTLVLHCEDQVGKRLRSTGTPWKRGRAAARCAPHCAPCSRKMGPVDLLYEPSAIRREFGKYDMDVRLDAPAQRFTDGTKGSSSLAQVPVQAVSMMSRHDGAWEKTWTPALVDTLVKAVRDGEDISPPAYPGSAIQLMQALTQYVAPAFPNKHVRVMVAGSISPWVEAVVLAAAAEGVMAVQSVTTTDYQDIDIQHNDINYLAMADLDAHPPDNFFDVIFSYSSLEHDGLGRYGDPINPNGDLVAMQELHQVLAPGGVLAFAVPFSKAQSGTVDGNWHRIYSKARIARMCEGFGWVGTVLPVVPVGNPAKGPWENQPIFVLRKS
jgi:hypothetical protein